MRPNLWIVVVVERKIERFRVAFTANGKYQTQGDISFNQEINGHKLCKIIVMDQTDRHETTNFFVQIQQLNRLPTKTALGWRSGEGTCLLSPGGRGYSIPIMSFMGRLRPKGVPFSCFRYMKGQVCCWFSSLPRSFSLRVPVFPSLQKPTFSNSNSIRNARTHLSEFLTTSKCSVGKQITNYNFIYLFFRLIPWSVKIDVAV